MIPGVEMSPLYRDWLGLESMETKPALLPRLLAWLVGADRFLIV